MVQCSFEKEEILEDGGLLRSACFNKAEILFVNNPCYGLCYACAYRKLQAENKRLRKTLGIAKDRFTNPDYGVDWQDAADDIDKVLKEREDE